MRIGDRHTRNTRAAVLRLYVLYTYYYLLLLHGIANVMSTQ